MIHRHDPKKMRAALDLWNSGARWQDVAKEFGWETEAAAMMAVRRFVKRTKLKVRRVNEDITPVEVKFKAYNDACNGVPWSEIAKSHGFYCAAEAERRVVRWACGSAGLPAPIIIFNQKRRSP